MTCCITDCNRRVLAKSYCSRHYQRVKRFGDPHVANKIFTTRKSKHGLAGTRTQKSWMMMKSRCNNPNYDGYKYYGGRGIKVCERWNSLELFLADMGERPEGMTLDRIDVNGDYEPNNCRWADPTTQGVNKRLSSRNTSGHVGVYYRNDTHKWSAEIMRRGIKTCVGCYNTTQEAVNARKAKLAEMGF